MTVVVEKPGSVSDARITVFPDSHTYTHLEVPEMSLPIMAQLIVIAFIAVADSTMAVVASVLYAAGWAIDTATWTQGNGAWFGAYVVFLLVAVLVKRIANDPGRTVFVRRKE